MRRVLSPFATSATLRAARFLSQYTMRPVTHYPPQLARHEFHRPCAGRPLAAPVTVPSRRLRGGTGRVAGATCERVSDAPETLPMSGVRAPVENSLSWSSAGVVWDDRVSPGGDRTGDTLTFSAI